jgi:hypothetical protein
MGAIPYALSISHFVSSVGADAGFAAIIGLAILILLYFAQARETASLRDRFSEAAEQVRRLELQVAHLSRPPAASQAEPAVAPRPAGVKAAAVPSRAARVLPVSEVPMAPAGVGAPALSAATRVIPSGDEGAISIRPGAARVAAAAGAAATAGASVAQGDDSREAQAASGGGGVIAPPAPSPPTGPAPATAAAAAAGAGAAAPAGAGAATGGRGNGGPNPSRGRTPAPAQAPGTGPPSRASQDPGRPYRIAGARPPGQPAQRQTLAPPAPPQRSRLRRALLVIVGLIVVAAIAAALVVVTSSNSNSGRQAGSGTSAANSNAPSAKRHRKTKAAALKPSQVTVAVLNGTATSNLAHDVSQKLTGAGYKPGMIATATDQTQAATTVGYMPGQRRAAAIVARSLNLGSTAIEPLTASNRAVACPQAACAAQIVVTVGSDLASDASTSSAAPSTTAAGTTT